MTRVLYDLAGRDDRRFSPYCWRAKLALRHKELDFESEPVRFTDKEKIAFSGQKLVPVLMDGDNVVADSWAIAEYLEKTYPDGPSLFNGETGHAMSRFMNRWVDEIQLALIPHVIHDIYRHVLPEDQEYFWESRTKRLGATPEELQRGRSAELLGTWRKSLGPARVVVDEFPFLGGNAPAYPDYIFFGMFQWARSISDYPLLETSDPIHGWRERMFDLFDGYARETPAYTV
ncbi:MAG: glutathione S-transferase family protein [Alphaproteobacteria bacterium]